MLILKSHNYLWTEVVQWYVEEDKSRKEKWETELTEDVFPKYLTDFETIAQKKGGYFGGKVNLEKIKM